MTKSKLFVDGGYDLTKHKSGLTCIIRKKCKLYILNAILLLIFFTNCTTY